MYLQISWVNLNRLSIAIETHVHTRHTAQTSLPFHAPPFKMAFNGPSHPNLYKYEI